MFINRKEEVSSLLRPILCSPPGLQQAANRLSTQSPALYPSAFGDTLLEPILAQILGCWLRRPSSRAQLGGGASHPLGSGRTGCSLRGWAQASPGLRGLWGRSPCTGVSVTVTTETSVPGTSVASDRTEPEGQRLLGSRLCLGPTCRCPGGVPTSVGVGRALSGLPSPCRRARPRPRSEAGMLRHVPRSKQITELSPPPPPSPVARDRCLLGERSGRVAWGLATRGGKDCAAVESPLNQEVLVQIEGLGHTILARIGHRCPVPCAFGLLGRCPGIPSWGGPSAKR